MSTTELEIFEVAPQPLIVNSEDWLRALYSINEHQAKMSRVTIAGCAATYGHRKCCCVCGEINDPLAVATQADSPLACLICPDCATIQSAAFGIIWTSMRQLTVAEEDYLMSAGLWKQHD